LSHDYEEENFLEKELREEIFEGETEEYRTYDSGKYPVVTDFYWISPGKLHVDFPDEDLFYYSYIQSPRGKEFLLLKNSGDRNCTFYFTETGTYSIQIMTENDPSAASVIESVDYVRPAETLDTPTGLRWSTESPWVAMWDPVPGADFYYVRAYEGDKDVAGRGFEVENVNGTQTCDLSNSYLGYVDPSENTYTFVVTAYNTDPTKYGNSDVSERSPAYGQAEEQEKKKIINGLAENADGNWYLYENGEINTAFSGLYCDVNVGWWLVLDGQVAFDYNDLYCDANYGWWKIAGGAVDFGYNDLYGSPTYGWWKVSGGAVDFGYTDLYGSPQYGWWKVIGGQVDFEYSDLYGSPTYGWWKVTGGAVDFGYTDLFGSPQYGWWKVNGGMVDFDYSDLYGSPGYGWWLVNGGAVDFGYTDIFVSPVYGGWKVSGGNVDFGFNGVYNSPRYGQCYVNGGQVNL
jgi:aryl carrier-like protein